jgi:hypothetical protein
MCLKFFPCCVANRYSAKLFWTTRRRITMSTSSFLLLCDKVTSAARTWWATQQRKKERGGNWRILIAARVPAQWLRGKALISFSYRALAPREEGAP